jgi:hypothetical protein
MRTFLLLLLASAMLPGADHSIGAWKLDVTQSKVDPPPVPYKRLAMVAKAAPNGVTLTVSGELLDGSPVTAVMTLPYDGTPVHFEGKGLPYDTVAAKQVDADHFIYERWKQGGSYHQVVKTEISADGKTRVQMGTGMGADGKPHESTLVFRRQ